MLLGLAPDSLGIQHGSTFDWPVLASALVTSILAALLFGLIPVLRFCRGNLTQVLGETGRSTSPGKTRHRVLNSLVCGQIAISTVLLVAAGLERCRFLVLTKTKNVSVLTIDTGAVVLAPLGLCRLSCEWSIREPFIT